jgi:GTP-binding protein
MRIKSVEFAGAIGQIGQSEPGSVEGLRQVAFAGRSNVGKSSLINRLLGRTRTPIARVSQSPGKTQEVNFYQVRADVGDFCLVDLPGYGYARAPMSVKAKWRPLITGYMRENPALAGVVQLVDMRHGPTADDRAAIDYLAELQIPVLFALTKLDKLNASQRTKMLREIPLALKLEPDQVIPLSAQSGAGIDELLDTLQALLFEG